MSKALKPVVSASVIGHLTPGHFEVLEEITDTCSQPARSPEESRNQLMAEVKFREILAETCPNAFLSFFSKFMKNLLRDLIVFRLKNINLTTQSKFTASNLEYHKKLIDAYRRNDQEAAFDIMKAHVDEVEKFVMSIKAIVEKKFLYL